ncbi:MULTISPECIES: hypothetical protein [unclassified Paenibacillus]|uniref:hypothetical protein n=1 Tax=unclassified Paenibacillus TaxID=185978 RepID=UPI00368F8DEC
MTRLLDARTSQNASFFNSINIPIPMNEATLIGQVGLITTGYDGTIRVQLEGTASFFAFYSATFYTFEIFAVRGTESTDTIVASNRIFFNANALNISNFYNVYLIGSDYNPTPTDDELVYSLFIRVNNDAILGGGVNRIGPESFNASAYCD